MNLLLLFKILFRILVHWFLPYIFKDNYLWWRLYIANESLKVALSKLHNDCLFIFALKLYSSSKLLTNNRLLNSAYEMYFVVIR